MLIIHFIIADDQKTAEEKLAEVERSASQSQRDIFYISSEKKRTVTVHSCFFNFAPNKGETFWSKPVSSQVRRYADHETYIAIITADDDSAKKQMADMYCLREGESRSEWKLNMLHTLACKALKQSFVFDDSDRLAARCCLSKDEHKGEERICVYDLRSSVTPSHVGSSKPEVRDDGSADDSPRP